MGWPKSISPHTLCFLGATFLFFRIKEHNSVTYILRMNHYWLSQKSCGDPCVPLPPASFLPDKSTLLFLSQCQSNPQPSFPNLPAIHSKGLFLLMSLIPWSLLVILFFKVIFSWRPGFWDVVICLILYSNLKAVSVHPPSSSVNMYNGFFPGQTSHCGLPMCAL